LFGIDSKILTRTIEETLYRCLYVHRIEKSRVSPKISIHESNFHPLSDQNTGKVLRRSPNLPCVGVAEESHTSHGGSPAYIGLYASCSADDGCTHPPSDSRESDTPGPQWKGHSVMPLDRKGQTRSNTECHHPALTTSLECSSCFFVFVP
jgi:hypothetical protein